MRRFFTRFPLDILAACVLLLLWALFLLSLKNPTSLDDGLRHFTMAIQMRNLGILAVPGWSHFFYQGYLHNLPLDPWFLSDVLLIPFTWLPIAKGLQLFVIAGVAVLFTAFMLILRSFRIAEREGVILLLLLVFGDAQFMGRFLLGRPYALMTAMTLLTLWCILERKWILLSVFLVVSVLLSQLFVFPLFLCACAVVAYLYTKEYGSALSVAGAAALGTLVGFLLHPHPLLYLQYLLTVFLKIPFLKSIGLSREMNSGVTDGSFLSVIALIAVILFLAIQLQQKSGLQRLRRDAGMLCLFMFTTVFIGVFSIWVRAIDVLWPLLVLCIARLYSLDRAAPRVLLEKLLPQQPRAKKTLIWLCIATCIVEITVLPYLFTRDDASRSLEPYAVLSVIPHGSRVLNLDWDQFFGYVAVRPDLTYAAGIDRAFTYLTDPAVSDAIYRLEKISGSQEEYPDIRNILDSILAVYKSDYLVLSYGKFTPVIQELKLNPAFGLEADNGKLAVFAVPDWFRPGRE